VLSEFITVSILVMMGGYSFGDMMYELICVVELDAFFIVFLSGVYATVAVERYWIVSCNGVYVNSSSASVCVIV
jgi:hypothetical protein